LYKALLLNTFFIMFGILSLLNLNVKVTICNGNEVFFLTKISS